MSRAPLDPIRPAIVGIAAIAACATAVTAFAFNTEAPAAIVLGVSALVGAAIALIAFHGIVRPLLTDVGSARTQQALARRELTVATSRRSLLERLDENLERADSEDRVIEVVGTSLASLFPDRDNAVLLAPPAGGRVTWLIEATESGLGEPIILDHAVACRALLDRTTNSVDSSAHHDACVHVARHEFQVSALCVPILIGNQHLGVAHSLGAPGDSPDPEAIRLLEIVTRRAGARVSELRAARRHDYSLPLDPITELPSQVLALREIRQHLDDEVSFSVAICDVDGFGPYNSEYGTTTGDRALRAYAEMLSATLRPTDTIARHDGDRFICVFPNCSALHAAAAMERVRESLILNLAMSELAPFSVSVGVAASHEATSSEELIDLVVTALSTAKVAGGNRVVRTDTLDTTV
ncbi:MAG: sensor domain-containing diguanylate cyclase [Actinobacteria bacterium]|nr:sensor domain-containing diguanylate cyclase [Actinomycetota bacterium]